MKNLVLIALLTVSQFAWSAPGGKAVEAQGKRVERMSNEDLVKNLKAIDEAVKGKIDIANNPKLKQILTKLIENYYFANVMKLSTSQTQSLTKAVAINPQKMLKLMGDLGAKAKDRSNSANERQQAVRQLALMTMASHTVNSLGSKSVASRQLNEVITVSEKIANLTQGEGRTFRKNYINALREGKDLATAIKDASKGKVTKKQLLECT